MVVLFTFDSWFITKWFARAGHAIIVLWREDFGVWYKILSSKLSESLKLLLLVAYLNVYLHHFTYLQLSTIDDLDGHRYLVPIFSRA